MRIEIFYPQKEEFKKQFTETTLELTQMFGGTTIIRDCLGIWMNPDNKVIHDKVVIILCYTEKSRFLQKQLEFFRLLERIKIQLNQRCIAYSINENINFY